ncbi:citrate transporter [Paenibacillus thiaminolyticus]|uniref:Citrate transporter n=2 Tax=Paenibacillus thiaminolyticus TaxID=49283 RepID=A0ABT4FUE4_PANTH|nr:citrate transporter [Paenibacillus thiaminolyticus]MCY9533727.1 citrate transporter [Paenibacillus thiaminolyticus]MCY9600218.1 citrate transporter [Paenibacillus thiaminolyticus]MCY9607778.1 citrate transporter [Paenibacillus thiaminolyticus]MCY9611969.1 citrate transporter [Paenibacillus thiaminolyticus]MCY9617811.1 citrate transporter [Paenibacillus thiaminolyticus]
MTSLMWVQAIGILLVFLVFVGLMMTRKLPTILALPLMAILFAVIAGVPWMSNDPEATTIAKTILSSGSMRLSGAIAGLIFGAWFGQILNKVGITKSIIRKAAELAGDKPVLIAVLFFATASIIFSAAGGLGMVILVGTIVIPIMLTAGISQFVASIVVISAVGVGALFNVSNWAVYVDVLGLSVQTIADYTLVAALPLILVSLAMIIFYIRRDGKGRKAWAMPTASGGEGKKVPAFALISPLVPVILVFAFKLDIVPAVVIGALVTILLTWPKRPIHVLSSALVEGIQDVAGAMALMIGIGILLNSVMAPQVSALISPLIEAVLPTSPLMYILFFTLLSPLAIYRGPLNVWGLGSGIAALFVSAGMTPVAAMLALRVVSNVQAVSDPTNSHNVWVADFTKSDINDILKKTLPWMMVAVLISMVLGSFMVF